MGLVNEYVILKWIKGMKISHYTEKGYIFTRIGDTFLVNVNDLPIGSHVKVNYICDSCGKEKQISYKDYLKNTVKCDKQYCYKCAIKIYDRQKTRDAKLINSMSFEKWCLSTLDELSAKQLLLKWDYNLNCVSPNEVTYCSSGINGKGYWFKCLNNLEHKSEQKRISDLVQGNKRNLDCNQCNSISCTHPELVKYFINKEDAHKYSFGSHKEASMRCPDCGYEKFMQIKDLCHQGFSCNVCGCGFSHPERFMTALLNQLGVRFISQLSKKHKHGKWCENFRFDFYLCNHNAIIEVHGLQHYTGWGYEDSSLTEIQQNDKLKRELAKRNNINYIEIEMCKSDLKYIEEKISNSILSEFIDMSKVNWVLCDKQALLGSNLIKQSCEMYNNGLTITQISTELAICRATIIRYLKRGSDIGWVLYKPRDISNKPIKVICLNTRKTFNSIKSASLYYNCNAQAIGKACNGYLKTAGKHPVTDEKLRWMHYDDYISLNHNKRER